MSQNSSEIKVKTKSLFKNTIQEDMEDIWIDSLEYKLDLCTADVMEYLENTANKYRDERKGDSRSICDQLQRIELPIFDGNKSNYLSWKAVFDACVDTSSVSPEIKLLNLCQYLKGDDLRAIDGLGHPAEAYSAAIEILENKFGGIRDKLRFFWNK